MNRTSPNLVACRAAPWPAARMPYGPTRLVDDEQADRNPHYMNTRRQDRDAADAAGTGPGQDPGGAAEHGAVSTAAAKVRAWSAGRIPGDWFTAAPDIQVDREEITIVGTLPDPAADPGAEGSEAADTAAADTEAERAAAAAGRIRRFREETRSRRIEIAREAEHQFRRKVSWGVTCGPVTEMFTTLSVPVMTRLRQSERRVLDTLVDAGVARSRSDALAWCVRLTGENADAWLARLRAALRQVEEVRDQGPGSALTNSGRLV
jgi:hypothetical protein